MTKEIRAVITGMETCLQTEGSWADTLKVLNIRNYTVRKALERADIQISDNRERVHVNGSSFGYGLYKGECFLKKDYLTKGAIARLLSNYDVWDSLDDAGCTLIISDALVSGPGAAEKWAGYARNFPDEKDYDIILLTGSFCNYSAYLKERDYNDFFYYVSSPSYGIFNLGAYIINPRIVRDLKSRISCKLELEDYLSDCINEFKWRVMAPTEVLFTQGMVSQRLASTFRPRKVLFYNRMFNMTDDLLSRVPRREGFELTRDTDWLWEADVVIFHMPTLYRSDKVLQKKNKREGQLWVFWTQECEAHFEWQYRRKVQRLFDIRATYKMGSDVPLPYISNAFYGWLRREPDEKTAFSNVFISSPLDRSGRFKYVRELMSCMDVHSYGKYRNNRKLDDDQGILSKAFKIAGYKFTLAFENAIAKDYVTEKFYQPLIMGSVPVYLGAPNIDEYAPGDQCYINVKNFRSPRDLAKYLKELDRDDARYEEYLQWKKRPFRDSFNIKFNTILKDEFERLYDVLEQRFGM